ncbi:MAG: hydantoinase/oxoprolinase family protein [Longimicrobiales bacterium]|nr:hydantoinase/oxoprolinase family protein [Longimicrobiales bacterium]
MSRSTEATSTTILAVDTGGTFTDLLLWTPGGLRRVKVPSTPDDPAAAVLEGIAEITGDEPPNSILHGSTVGTNALLERKGARIAFITNRGFEDIIEIGRQNRPQLYALVGHRPPPLVDREDRIGIAGRLGPDGDVIEPLDEEELAAVPERVEGVDAVAVVLLHSYADPGHEERVAEALGELDAPISVSSRLLPEYREYERASTTVVNAYITPVMSRYLERLDRETPGSRVRIMGSNGGALPVKRACDEAVHTVLSGPAGGVVGARDWAERSGYPNVVSLDMGGTSTDVSVCPGELLQTKEFEIAGHPVAVPVIDIHTVGAGGGSLARVDPGGALRVGPESAGADPGPICYGRGGEGVTVTDAHVWLGRLPPGAFLGGEVELDRDAVEPALNRLARELDRSPEATAEGILHVANSAMERALRVISVERGYDPADFALVAFGGAGGLHAAELAGGLGAARAIIPPDPGLLSAYGMLAAPVTRELSRSVLARGDEEGVESRLHEVFDELEEEGREAMVAEGVDRDRLSATRRIDARYPGQSFELRVPAEDWVESFHRAHEERYGYDRRDSPVEAVTVRVTVSAPGAALEPDPLKPGDAPPDTDRIRVHLDGGWKEARRVERRRLAAGAEVRGPAVIVEYSSTTWVPEGWTAGPDEWGCLHLVPAS